MESWDEKMSSGHEVLDKKLWWLKEKLQHINRQKKEKKFVSDLRPETYLDRFSSRNGAKWGVTRGVNSQNWIFDIRSWGQATALARARNPENPEKLHYYWYTYADCNITIPRLRRGLKILSPPRNGRLSKKKKSPPPSQVSRLPSNETPVEWKFMISW